MNLLLASTSTLFGGKYLEYLTKEIQELLGSQKEILFIPYARPSGISHDDYTKIAKKYFKTLYINVVGLHETDNPKKAIENSEAYFTGGGNSFLLLKTLQDLDLMKVLKQNIFSGKPYLGTSAGSNIMGMSIKTTNDMPIVFPKNFDAIGGVSFNINPHYLDPNPELKHNGETRETRIIEYLTQNNTPVVGLREGNWIRKKSEKTTVEGTVNTRIFIQNKSPYEIPPESDIGFLEKLNF